MSWSWQLRCFSIAALMALCGSARAQSLAAHEDDAAQSAGEPTQRVVLLVRNLDSHAVAALARSVADLGVQMRSVREAKLDPALEACGTLSCLAEIARIVEGRSALAEMSTSAEGIRTLLLVVVDVDGRSAQAKTRIGRAGLEEAFLTAWKEASLALTLAGLSMIQAESRPSGATVWCDGVRAGSTPWVRQIVAGRHRLRIELDGFVSQERVVDAQAGRLQRVDVVLKRAPRFGAGQLAAAPAAVASPWNTILGGALALAAAPALIATMNALAADGQCLDPAAGSGCRHRAHFGTSDAYAFALGVVALGTGGTLLFARPLEVSVPPVDSEP